MNPSINLRIIVVDPPTGVTFALQAGKANLQPPEKASPELVFEFSLTVADLDSTPPRLTGKFAQGPPARRFVYVNSGTMAGERQSCWTRRAKVPLSGISTALIEKALQDDQVVLEASIAGKAKDGGPACASVPLLTAWTARTRR
jgi:hypothetical protein